MSAQTEVVSVDAAPEFTLMAGPAVAETGSATVLPVIFSCIVPLPKLAMALKPKPVT